MNDSNSDDFVLVEHSEPQVHAAAQGSPTGQPMSTDAVPVVADFSVAPQKDQPSGNSAHPASSATDQQTVAQPACSKPGILKKKGAGKSQKQNSGKQSQERSAISVKVPAVAAVKPKVTPNQQQTALARTRSLGNSLNVASATPIRQEEIVIYTSGLRPGPPQKSALEAYRKGIFPHRSVIPGLTPEQEFRHLIKDVRELLGEMYDMIEWEEQMVGNDPRFAYRHFLRKIAEATETQQYLQFNPHAARFELGPTHWDESTPRVRFELNPPEKMSVHLSQIERSTLFTCYHIVWERAEGAVPPLPTQDPAVYKDVERLYAHDLLPMEEETVTHKVQSAGNLALRCWTELQKYYRSPNAVTIHGLEPKMFHYMRTIQEVVEVIGTELFELSKMPDIIGQFATLVIIGANRRVKVAKPVREALHKVWTDVVDRNNPQMTTILNCIRKHRTMKKDDRPVHDITYYRNIFIYPAFSAIGFKPTRDLVRPPHIVAAQQGGQQSRAGARQKPQHPRAQPQQEQREGRQQQDDISEQSEEAQHGQESDHRSQDQGESSKTK